MVLKQLYNLLMKVYALNKFDMNYMWIVNVVCDIVVGYDMLKR